METVRLLIGAGATDDVRSEAYRVLYEGIYTTEGVPQTRMAEDLAGAQAGEGVSTVITSCTRDISCGGEDLRRAALGVAGAVVNNKELRKRMTGEEIRNLIGAACACSEDEGRDMHTRAKCMWMLAMQTFSGAQVSSMLVKMISAIIECINWGSATSGEAEQGWALAREGLSALERVLKQAPSNNRAMQDRSITSLKGGHGWLPLLITCIVSPDAETRRCAHAALAAADAVLSGVDKEAIEDAVVPRLGQLLPWITEKTASGKEGESWDGLRAWDAIVALAGERMVRGGQINQVLKVMEDPFASEHAVIREQAHAAWHTLACVFGSMASTMAHAKRLALIMAPIVNAITGDRNEQVRLSALRTWSSVVRMLGSQASQTYSVAIGPVITASISDQSDEVKKQALGIMASLISLSLQPGQRPSPLSAPPSTIAEPLSGLTIEVIAGGWLGFRDSLWAASTHEKQDVRDKSVAVWAALFRRLSASAESSKGSKVQLAGEQQHEVQAEAAQKEARDVMTLAEAVVCFLCNKLPYCLSLDKGRVAASILAGPALGTTEGVRLLLSTSSQLPSPPGETPGVRVKLTAYIAGAVARMSPTEEGAALFRRAVRVCEAAGDQGKVLAQCSLAVSNAYDDSRRNGTCRPETFLKCWEDIAGEFGEGKGGRGVGSTPTRAGRNVQASLQLLSFPLKVVSQAQKESDGQTIDSAWTRAWARLFSHHRSAMLAKTFHALSASGSVCSATAQYSPTLPLAMFVLRAALEEESFEEISTKANARPVHPMDSAASDVALLLSVALSIALDGAKTNPPASIAETKEALLMLKRLLQHVNSQSQLIGVCKHTSDSVEKCLAACTKGKGDSADSLYHHGATGIADEVEAAWEAMCVSTQRVAALSSDLGGALDALSQCMALGLASANRKIQNATVGLWNTTFATAKKASLQCSVELRAALTKVSRKTPLNLAALAKPTAVLGKTHETAKSPTSSSGSNTSPHNLEDTSSQLAESQTKGAFSPLRFTHSSTVRGSLLHQSPTATVKRPPSAPPSPAQPSKVARPNPSPSSPARPQQSGGGEGGGFVKITTPEKRKAVLTEHQKEVARQHRAGGAVMGFIAYSGLEDAESQFGQVDEGTMNDSRSRWGQRSDTLMHPVHATFASPPAIGGAASGTGGTPATVKAGKEQGRLGKEPSKVLEYTADDYMARLRELKSGQQQ